MHGEPAEHADQDPVVGGEDRGRRHGGREQLGGDPFRIGDVVEAEANECVIDRLTRRVERVTPREPVLRLTPAAAATSCIVRRPPLITRLR